jgi:hypothetical protein
MKFVLVYKLRGNDTAKGIDDSERSAQKLLTSWQPHAPEGISEWLTRVDGSGGFAVVETDDAAALWKDLATWTVWLEFEAIPVIDIGESTAKVDEVFQARAGAFD